MEHDPVKMLYEEHEVIVNAVEQALELENTWEADPDSYQARTLELVDFFKEYADGYHHRKEEDILFPAIKDHPDFVLQEVIDEFIQHHEDFREYARQVREAIGEGDLAGSFKLLKAYGNDLLDHIAAENDELFVMAESLFSEDELQTLFFRFKDADMELGEGRKAELEQG